VTAARSADIAGHPLLAELSAGAVDMFDVAARLEASGVSDRTAKGQHGRSDVFALAADLHGDRPTAAADAPRRNQPSGLAEAFRRALLLVGGVLLAAALLDHLTVAPALVWVAGVTAWVGGQASAAISWNRLGLGQRDLGLRRGCGAALLMLAAAVAVPLAAPGLTEQRLVAVAVCAGWTAYACAVSLLVCSGRTGAALVTVGGGTLVVGMAEVLGDGWWAGTLPVVVVLTTTLAVVLLAVRRVLRAGLPAVPDRADWAAAAPAVAQAALLALSLVLLLRTVPQEGTSPLVVASVVGAATADPAIALLRARLRAAAARVYALADAARHARRAALIAAAGTALVSAVAAVGVVVAVQAGFPSWPAIVGPAAAYTALATTSAALTAFGAPAKAVVTAALAGGYAISALFSGVVAVVAVFPVCLIVAVGLLMHRISDPRVVA